MKADSALVTDVAPSPNFGDRRGKSVDALILHYTGMSSGARALSRLCQAGSDVSCHYFVWEDGRIVQLVAERQRAWHAGRAFWAGETDINALSIGIEIVNAGHAGGCPPYPAPQIAGVVALVRDICARNGIAPHRVLGHSDVAPTRKEDPGEYFPWERLAAVGLAMAVEPAPILEGFVIGLGSAGQAIVRLQGALSLIGYKIEVNGRFDDETEAVVRAFQRRFRPAQVDGIADASTLATLDALSGQLRETGA